MSSNLRVLIIEDSEDDVLLMLRELRKGDYEPDYECIDTEAAMMNALQSREWDVIICDFNMPSFRGDHALSLLKKSGLDVPFILVSGTIGEEIAVDMMKAGAHDYIMKDNLTRLVPAIRRELRDAKNRQEKRNALVALQQSEEKYRMILQSMNDLVFVVDKHDCYSQYYTASEELLFVSPEEFMGQPVSEVLPPSVGERFVESFQRVRETGSSETFDYQLEISGQKHWFSAVLTMQENDESIVQVVRDITRRKQAEEAMRESETKYRLLAENTFDCVWQMDLNTDFTYVNPAILRVFGFTPEEWVGSSVGEHCSPEAMELLSDLMMEIIRQGPNAIPATFETRMLRKDGKEIDVEITAELILDEDTNPLLFQGTTRDITGRKRAEEALRESEEWFRAVYEESPIAINVFDQNGNLIHMNPACVDFAGVSSLEDLKDFNIFEDPNFPEDKKQQLRNGESVLFRSIIDWSKVKEARLYDTIKSGVSYVETGASPLKYGADESLHGYMIQMVDITDRVLAEKEVRASEERYRGLVERMSEVVFRLSMPDAKYEYMSPSISPLLGYPAEEFLDNPLLFLKVVHPDSLDYFTKAFGEMVESNLFSTIEYRIIDTSGNTKWVSQSNSPVYDDEGNLIAVEGICRDVSDRKKAEEDMRTAAETAMLYLDLMGHDIRNHLQAIIMGTEILDQLDTRPEVREMVDLVASSVESSRNLIKKVQATRGLLSVPLSSTPLRDALEDCLQVLNETYDDVQIEMNLAAQQPTVFADKYLGNLLMNILENAILHNDRKTKRIWLDLKKAKEGYEVVIADNGPGMNNDTKENLFDQSRRFGGVGVHQAFKIIQKYGGHITVQDRVPSDSSKGAEFHIWFPKATL